MPNSLPPGPSWYHYFQKTPTESGEMMVHYMRKYGSLYTMVRLEKKIVVTDPQYIKQIMITERENYQRVGKLFRRMASLLGNGLLTYPIPQWQQQRTLYQPLLQPKYLHNYRDILLEEINILLNRFSHFAKHNKTVSLNKEIMGCVLNVASRCLVHMDIRNEAPDYIRAIAGGNSKKGRFFLPLWVPSSINHRIKFVHSSIQDKFREQIDKRRAMPRSQRPEDLLTVLINAQEDKPDIPITDDLILGELQTFLITGHETTGNALIWAFFELARNPKLYLQLLRESASCQKQVPEDKDLENLPFAKMVFDETLRLYPPIWLVSRENVTDTELGGYHIPKGTQCMICSYALHRNKQYWPEPEVFMPERFAKPNHHLRSKQAYIPFGYGPTTCIASSFAHYEGQLMLNIISQHFRIHLANSRTIEKDYLITLKPAQQIKVKIEQL